MNKNTMQIWLNMSMLKVILSMRAIQPVDKSQIVIMVVMTHRYYLNQIIVRSNRYFLTTLIHSIVLTAVVPAAPALSLFVSRDASPESHKAQCLGWLP